MGRSACCVKEGVNRGAWSAKEDRILTNYIKIHGAGKWRSVSDKAGLKRSGQSCRLRWLNYLRPDIRRGDISMDEADLIIRLHRLLGNRWALIAGRLPGRTDNEIKNYWKTNLAKKLKDGQISHDPSSTLISEMKKPVQDSAPDIPQVKTQKDDGTLNFLMDFNVDEVLTTDVLSSKFLKLQNNDMHKNGNMVGGDKICAILSSDCHISGDNVLPENDMKCGPIQPTLELELKRMASFLDLEEEWKEF